jgi:RNA polymerase sigma-70 factor, ECF subfamily
MMGRLLTSKGEVSPDRVTEGLGPRLRRRTPVLSLYDLWYTSVLKWVRALGGPAADREDIAQEVFLVASRRLHAFDGRNPAAWLYRITQRQVRDFRRRSWVKSIFTRDHVDAVEDLPDDESVGPAGVLERKQRERTLVTLLSKMNVDRRAAFVLFEIDGLSGEQIARIQDVSVNTVWKRLHVARKEFLALIVRHERRNEPVARPRRTPRSRP